MRTKSFCQGALLGLLGLLLVCCQLLWRACRSRLFREDAVHGEGKFNTPIFKKPLIPIFKKSLPPLVPIFKKPLPPLTPIFEKPLPPPVLTFEKPLPPPIPVLKKSPPPPVPIFKKQPPPPVPIFKK
ncbi:hypothetical protein SO802_008613 [Lithocarpus litseifolius]|uniref:Uncharacterized protein n=1 Tax=Lithocarpus litseifolius TaxID=425828 RepID=A0AAW2DDA3_9ROSI